MYQYTGAASINIFFFTGDFMVVNMPYILFCFQSRAAVHGTVDIIGREVKQPEEKKRRLQSGHAARAVQPQSENSSPPPPPRVNRCRRRYTVPLAETTLNKGKLCT